MEENEFIDLGFMSDDDFQKISESSTDNTDDVKDRTDNKTSVATEDKDTPESVGGEENIDEEDDDQDLDDSEQGSSSNNFSSIAKALKDIEVLHLQDEDLDEIDSAAAFSEAIEAEINLRRSELDRYLIKAFTAGVPVPVINQIQANLQQLNSIQDSDIEDESNGLLRELLIYRSYLMLGMDENKAAKMTKRSMDSANDIEDAKEAIEVCRDYYSQAFDSEVEKAEYAKQERENYIKNMHNNLKKSIMDDNDIYKELSITNNIRNRIYENAMVNTEDYNGSKVSKIRKFAMEHPIEYNKWTATFFTLTDGFTNVKNLLNGAVNTETKKRMNNLEKALKTSNITRGGNMKLTSGVDSDSGLLDFSGDGGWTIAD